MNYSDRFLTRTARCYAPALLAAALAMLAPAVGRAQDSPPLEGDSLYRVWTLRAAPGDLLEVIDRLRGRMPVWTEALGAEPLMMRHSQGDQWDLLVLFPWGSSEQHYSAAALEHRRRAATASGGAEAAFVEQLLPLLSWQQDWWAHGVAPVELARRARDAGLFHVEMFLALPGQRATLLQQRRMENDYLRHIGWQQNLIFSRVGGAPWDSATIGFYRDLKEFAASVDVPAEREEEAAKAAGFEGAGFIGSYLRSLIAEHHDTLAVAIPSDATRPD